MPARRPGRAAPRGLAEYRFVTRSPARLGRSMDGQCGQEGAPDGSGGAFSSGQVPSGVDGGTQPSTGSSPARVRPQKADELHVSPVLELLTVFGFPLLVGTGVLPLQVR